MFGNGLDVMVFVPGLFILGAFFQFVENLIW